MFWRCCFVENKIFVWNLYVNVCVVCFFWFGEEDVYIEIVYFVVELECCKELCDEVFVFFD